MITNERKYPIGIQTFEKVIGGRYVYADKTDLVWMMTKLSNYVFLSRPRRFGKRSNTKGYATPYATDGHRVVNAGIRFNIDSRTIEEWIIE